MVLEPIQEAISEINSPQGEQEDGSKDLGFPTEPVPVNAALVQAYPPQFTSVSTQTDPVVPGPVKAMAVQTYPAQVKSVSTQTDQVVEGEVNLDRHIRTDPLGTGLQGAEADVENLDTVAPPGVEAECLELHKSISLNIHTIDITADEVIYILDQLLLMYP